MGITITRQPAEGVGKQIVERISSIYHATALKAVTRATKGLTEGTDYFVYVDGHRTNVAGISQARLGGSGVLVTRKGTTADLLQAARLALAYLEGFPFRQSTGTLKASIGIRANGRDIPSLNDRRAITANTLVIYSRAIHASPLEAIYKGHVFLSAAKRADSIPGIAARMLYGRPNDYAQDAAGRPQKYAVPIIVITFPNHASGITAASQNFQLSRASAGRRRSRARGLRT